MHDNELRALRDQGYRLTRQRMLILGIIRDRGQHISADEIFTEVRRQAPDINLATVYRTLQWLHGVGLLRKIDVGKDRLEYEYAGQHVHHHLICKECGATTEIDNYMIEDLQQHILDQYGFEADPAHLAIFGRCAQCRQPTT